MNLVPIFCIFALSLIHTSSGAAPLKICSFNVQIFGSNKAERSDVMDILARIFSRFDLCLIQEIRDNKDTSINALLAAINKKSNTYGLILSERLGRTNSKEQYGFFYNKKRVSVASNFTFDDGSEAAGTDLFQREPFVVRFKAPDAAVKDFFIAGIHVEPKTAVEEVGNLVKVYDDAAKRFNVKDGIIMGDFNAGCGYFAKKHWKTNPLRTDQRFLWLIGDDADTTVGDAECAYDRIVVAGDGLRTHAKGASTWLYDQEFGIEAEQTKLVSDHYPIQFFLQ